MDFVYNLLKIIITAVLIWLISEIGKKYSMWAAILASLPLTSIFAMIWIYVDTGSSEKIGELSSSVFWMVIPSLVFFIILPLLLKKDLNFWFSLVISSFVTFLSYHGFIKLLSKIGIKI